MGWFNAFIMANLVGIGSNLDNSGVGLSYGASKVNVASGFGATVSNAASLWSIVASITIWGYIMFWLGNVVGLGAVSRFLGKYASLIAGLVLVAVGIHQVYWV